MLLLPCDKDDEEPIVGEVVPPASSAPFGPLGEYATRPPLGFDEVDPEREGFPGWEALAEDGVPLDDNDWPGEEALGEAPPDEDCLPVGGLDKDADEGL